MSDRNEDGSSEYAGAHASRKWRRASKRTAMYKAITKRGLCRRVTFPNDGTCLLDGKFYYYAQKKRARVKGTTEYQEMRGICHFLDTFAKPVETQASRPVGPHRVLVTMVCMDCEAKYTTDDKIKRKGARVLCPSCNGMLTLEHQHEAGA